MASEKKEQLLSERAQKLSMEKCFLTEHMFACMENPWSAKNEKGYINLGTAENYLAVDLMTEKFSEPGFYEFDSSMLHYFKYHGSKSTRAVAARFIQKRMRADHEIKVDNLAMLLGTCSALDIASHIIADPGDVFLCATPCYARIHGDCYERSLIDIYPIRLTSQISESDRTAFHLTADRLKETYEKATNEGKKVKGVVLLDPSNPLGSFLPRAELMKIFEFCASKKIYCIVDEIYALSTFGDRSEKMFDSVLSFWQQLPDQQRVVWLWGMSKDLANPGARVSFLYCSNTPFMDCVKKLAVYQCVPSLMHRMVEKILADDEWLDNVYFPTNIARMTKNYEYASSRLQKMGVFHVEAHAGLFIFGDFRKYMKELTFAEERTLFTKFFKGGVYVIPGEKFYCCEPGWFRIVFTVSSDMLEEGMNRIEKVLNSVSKIHGDTAHG